MYISFRLWLENDRNDQTELRVANFLEDAVEKASQAMLQDPQPKSFSHYMHQQWPPQAKNNHGLVLPDIFPNDIAGQPVDFKYFQGGRAYAWHTNNAFAGFVINLTPFRRKTSTQLQDAAQALKSAVHHEAEHIYNPGDDYEVQEDEDPVHKTLVYMSNSGEVRAHARELAWGYARNFPKQSFQLEKAQQMLDQPYFNETHKNYLVKLADPQKWQTLKTKYQLTHNPHEQVVALIQQFLPQYNQ
jgi:hypothetical protein